MDVRKVTPEALFAKMEKEDNVFLLDVRVEEKYEDYHIEGTNIDSKNIPKTNIFELAEGKGEVDISLPKDKQVIVTCTTGNSATKCATILAGKDFDVVVLDGGITAWKKFLSNKK